MSKKKKKQKSDKNLLLEKVVLATAIISLVDRVLEFIQNLFN